MLLVFFGELELGRALFIEVDEKESSDGLLHKLIGLAFGLECPLKQFQCCSHQDDMSYVLVLY